MLFNPETVKGFTEDICKLFRWYGWRFIYCYVALQGITSRDIPDCVAPRTGQWEAVLPERDVRGGIHAVAAAYADTESRKPE